MRDLIMVVAFLGLIPLAIKKPFIALMLWIWSALLVPKYMVYGFAGGIRYNLIFAALTFLAIFISKNKFRLNVTGTTVLLLLFLAHTSISTFTSISNSPYGFTEWTNFIKVITFFMLIPAILDDRLKIHSLLLIFCVSLGFHGGIEGLKFILSGGGHSIAGPSGSVLEDNNHFSLAIIMLAPIVLYLYHYSDIKWIRWTFLGLLATFVLTVVGTGSRGGLLGLLAIVAWALLTSKNRFKIIALMIPLTLLVLTVAQDSWFERMDTIDKADEDTSFLGRISAWNTAILIASDYPLTGAGFRSMQTPHIWAQYVYREKPLSFFDTSERLWERPRAAHSIYFQVMSDHGFLGLFLFLLILANAWFHTVHIIRRTKNIPSLLWMRDLAVSIQLSLVAYLVSGAALSLAYFELLYALIGILIALKLILKKQVLNKNSHPKARVRRAY